MKTVVIAILSIFISHTAYNPTAVPKPFVGLTVKKVAPSEYRCGYMYSDGSVWKYLFNGSAVVFAPYVFGGNTAIDIAPGFNRTIILDNTHHAWSENLASNTGACTRFDTDTAGADFNDLAALYTYFGSYFAPSIDSTKIWAFGDADSYKWFDNTGTRPYKPYVLWTAPSGKKIKKLACGRTFMILLTSGEVYERLNGDLTGTFTKRTFTGTCVDIAASQNDFCLYLIHDYSGGDQTMGRPYWTKSETSFIGDNNSRSEPYALQTLWGTGSLSFRSIVCNTNTYHMFDSAWALWGGGDGAQGEIGDSTCLVGSYTYLAYSGNAFAWNTNKCQGGSCKMPKRIMRNIDWTGARFPGVGNSFTFYQYISLPNDSLYVTGRTKSYVSNFIYCNQESTIPNTLDRKWFQQYTPMAHPNGVSIDFSYPIVHCGGNKSVVGTATTVGGLDTAAANGSFKRTIVSTLWTQMSGPTATIASPNSATTVITNLGVGTSVFKKEVADDNNGVWADSVTLTVTAAPAGCTNCYIKPKGFREKKLTL